VANNAAANIRSTFIGHQSYHLWEAAMPAMVARMAASHRQKD